MKKRLTKTLVLVGIIILATASFAFADETEERPFYDRMVALLENQYPEALDEWIDKFEEHKAVHANLTEVREAIKAYAEEATAEIKAEIKTQNEELKAAVQAGEMTVEEAREAFGEFIEPYKELKEERAEEREKNKTISEGIREHILANKEDRIAKRQELKEVIQDDEDSSMIQNLIDELIDLQEIHLEYDYEKLDLLNGIYEELE